MKRGGSTCGRCGTRIHQHVSLDEDRTPFPLLTPGPDAADKGREETRRDEMMRSMGDELDDGS